MLIVSFQVNPDLIYVCDPVMGDTGPGLYVPKYHPIILCFNLELLFQLPGWLFQFPPGNYCQCTKMWSYPWQMWPFPISLRQSLSQVQYLWISQWVFCSRSDHHKWEGGPCSDGDAAQEGCLHSHPVKVQQVNVTKPYYHWNTALSLEAETTWWDWQAVARLAPKSK